MGGKGADLILADLLPAELHPSHFLPLIPPSLPPFFSSWRTPPWLGLMTTRSLRRLRPRW